MWKEEGPSVKTTLAYILAQPVFNYRQAIFSDSAIILCCVLKIESLPPTMPKTKEVGEELLGAF